MKYILHIAAALKIGGAEKVARDIGLYADSAEYENHYIVFEDSIGAYENELVAHGCKIFHIDPPGKNYLNYYSNLKKILSKYPYTAVHAHTMFNAGWAMLAAKKAGVPVRIAHAHSALDTDFGLKQKLYESIMQSLILKYSTALIACGERAGIRLFGSDAYFNKAKLILNGIDTRAFKYNEKSRDEIRSQYNLGKSFVIGHAGHLAAVKNQKYLLEMMPDIIRIRPDVVLMLLGDGEDRKMLETMIHELGISDHVIMTGNVLNVSDYLSAMDVFAFPSLYEGMPLSIIEVQANGLPCVISCGVPEDVYLTDLVYPAPLSQKNKWLELICNLERKSPEAYSERLYAAGYDVNGVMRKIYDIYEGK